MFRIDYTEDFPIYQISASDYSGRIKLSISKRFKKYYRRCKSGGSILGVTSREVNDCWVKSLKNTDTDISDNGNLYFLKSCTYPRFKIKSTKYKKVNNPTEADYIICNECPQFNHFYDKIHVYKTAECYIVVEDSILSMFNTRYNSNSINFIISYYNEGPENRLYGNVISLKNDYNASLIYSGNAIYGDTDDIEDIETLLNHFHIKFLYAATLDKIICNKLHTASFADIKSIIDLLSSIDEKTVELGWKTLQGFNVTSTPAVFKSIILLYSARMSKNILNSVGMQTILLTLKISPRQVRSHVYADIIYFRNNLDTSNLTDEEKYLLNYIVSQKIKADLNKYIKTVTHIYSDLGVNIDYNVSFDESCLHQ